MQSLVEAARAEIARAANIEELEQIRVRLLGKKGEITAQLKTLGAMDPEARKAAGAKINEAKEALTTALDARRAELENEQLAAQLRRPLDQERSQQRRCGAGAGSIHHVDQ